jgi:hypothetical protein
LGISNPGNSVNGKTSLGICSECPLALDEACEAKVIIHDATKPYNRYQVTDTGISPMLFPPRMRLSSGTHTNILKAP